MSEVRGHTLKAVLDIDTPCLSVVCHLTDGAACRRARTRGCEDTCDDPDNHIKPVGYCLAAEWMGLEGTAESYAGNDVLSLRDGMPISVEWTGDDYVWEAISE